MEKKELLPTIRELYKQLGISVTQVGNVVSPNMITLYYNLYSIERLTEAKKKLEFISAYLHYDLQFSKSAISHFAIKIPVNEKKEVNFSDKDYENAFFKPFSIFAGIGEDNKPVVIHLDKTAHILIAGASGSGKSVMMNSAICSLLKTSNKDNIMFYLIDTKIVELSKYKALGKNAVVATECEDAIQILKYVCDEMDRRYLKMEKMNIQKVTNEFPRIVVCIEELADLLYFDKKTCEPYIVRISRLGRACGVTLIIATQNPTADVVTKGIKANITCRFCMRTSTIRESVNCLDRKGAESLRNDGDCLLKVPVTSTPIRIQCPLCTNEDVQTCIENFKKGVINE